MLPMAPRQSAQRADPHRRDKCGSVLGWATRVYARSAALARDPRPPPLLRDGVRRARCAHVDRLRIRDCSLHPRQAGDCTVLERSQPTTSTSASRGEARSVFRSGVSTPARQVGRAARGRSPHAPANGALRCGGRRRRLVLGSRKGHVMSAQIHGKQSSLASLATWSGG